MKILGRNCFILNKNGLVTRIVSIEDVKLIEPLIITTVCEIEKNDIHLLNASKDDVKSIKLEDGTIILCIYCEKHNQYVELKKA